MKLPVVFAAVLLASLCLAVAADGKKSAKKADPHALPGGARELNIGDAAPDFALPGIDGRTHRLADYKDARLLMIAFISNHCPDSHAAEGRIKQLVADMKGRGFALVAVNPNNPDGLRLDELGYSKYNDGFDDMKKYAAEQGFNFPYLYDGEKQAMAKAYGCLATPHVFLFDAERKLRYKGQFDDSRFADAARVKSHDARNAVEALLAGKPVPVETTKPHGCSTKWMEKKNTVAEAEEKWAKTPVDVELIDAAGVAALRKNGTKKVRLFNVWATWCGPCVAEFPELVMTARKFGLRDFELITISMDEEGDVAKVKAFLEKKGAGLPDKLKPSLKAEGRKTNSYLYGGDSPKALMAVLDPHWPGAIPHSVLVAPGGEILWRHNGAVNGEELRAKILEHMGPFYLPE
ncbi:MAG: redoxin domain-containing protein [Verrucomicrobia bacterium]|nr:redoxin domain-containing protein [Verrucomicrobiota bacterium]